MIRDVPVKALRRKMLAEAGVMLALAFVLEYITMFLPKLPQGGKFVSLGMVPLIIFSIRWGGRAGMLAGAAFGLLYYQLDPFFIHPVQFILDYPLAFSMAGVAGFVVRKDSHRSMQAGIILTMALRFICHLMSGVIFFKAFMPGNIQNPWIYSAVYNGMFIVPTAIVCCFIVPYINRRFEMKAG
ncbi:MAG: energy-coupled thiamine transporter ThiT [Firmicutes bacterium]|nr:energy-coupled thiamine transporter ThiT [Bacillota bacterium]